MLPPPFFFFLKKFIFKICLATLLGVQDLSSLTRDQSHASCIGSKES